MKFGVVKRLFVVAIVCSVISCGGQRNGGASESGGTPQISFDNDSFNFGTIAQGEKVSHTFKFRNIGDGNLVITDVTTSCGCTASKYSVEPVASGENGTIEVIFDSYGREGKQLKSANVWTNCSSEPVKLQIFANIETLNK